MSKFATKGFVVAMMGSGGSTPSANKNCGYIYKTSTGFPTTRTDGSALQNEDYVIASGKTTDFPFTIGTVTFDAALQKAYYDANTKIWMTDSGAITSTDEVNLKDISTESLSGTANTQQGVNTENVAQLKALYKSITYDKAIQKITLTKVDNTSTEDILENLATTIEINCTSISEHKYDFVLKDISGTEISKASIDLPLELIKLVDFEYDNENEKFILKWSDAQGTEHIIDIPASGILNGIVTETATQTLTNKTINADNNTISNLETDNFKENIIDISVLTSTDNAHLASSKLIKTEIDKTGHKLEASYANNNLTIKLLDNNDNVLTTKTIQLESIKSMSWDKINSKIIVTKADDTTTDVILTDVVITDAIQTITNKDINADNNTIFNLETDNLKTGILDTETLTEDDLHLASSKLIKNLIDTKQDATDDELATDDKTITGAINENNNLIKSLSKPASIKVVATQPTVATNGITYYIGTSAPYTIKLYNDNTWYDLGTSSTDLTNYATKTELATEKKNRIDADTTLQTNISNEITNRTTADTTLQTNIDNEAATRATKDNSLQTSIETEITNRTNADTELNTKISNESEIRLNNDTDLQTNIDNEATARKNNDTILQTNIDNEATARNTKDTELQTNIDKKQNKEDNTLETDNKTITGAINENNNLIKSLSKPVTIKVVDTQPETGTNGVTYYIGSEAPYTVKLYNENKWYDLGTSSTDLSNYATKDNLNTEITNRTTADTTLQTNIDNEANTRTTEDTKLQTNIDKKQDILTAGTGINIASNTVSAKTKILKVDGTEYDLRGDGIVEINGVDAYTKAEIDTKVKTINESIETETTARTTVDTTLQTNITTEATTRENKDTELQAKIDKKQDILTAGNGIDINSSNTISTKTKTLKVDTTEYDIKGDGTITLDTAIIKVSELPSANIKDKCMYLLTLNWTEVGKYDTTDSEKYIVQKDGLNVNGTLVTWDAVNTNWSTYYPSMITDNDSGNIRRNQKPDGTYTITYGSYTTKNGLYYYDNGEWVMAGSGSGGEASSVQWGGIGGNLNNQTDVITKFNDMNATLELRKQEIEAMQAQITEMLTNITNNTTDISDLKVDVPKKQDKEDSSLATDTKTVVGGINELKTKVDNLSSAVQYQGIVDSESALPTTAEVGDMYYVKNNSFFIYGNDKTWQSTGDSIDLTKLVNITDTQTIAGNKTFTGTTTTSNITTGTITTTDTANLTSGINLNSAGTISLTTSGIKNGSYTYGLPTYAENSTLATLAEVELKQHKIQAGDWIKIDETVDPYKVKADLTLKDIAVGDVSAYFTAHSSRIQSISGYIGKTGSLILVELKWVFNPSAKSSYGADEWFNLIKPLSTFTALEKKLNGFYASYGGQANDKATNGLHGAQLCQGPGGTIGISFKQAVTVDNSTIWHGQLMFPAASSDIS